MLETLPLDAAPTTSSSTTRCSPRRSHFGFRIGEISCPTQYFPEASSINFRRSVVYGFGVLRTAFAYRLNRLGLRQDPLFAPAEGTRVHPVAETPRR